MFKKVKEDAILPTKGSKYSACVDVYANEDVTIGAGETKLVGLGVAIDLDYRELGFTFQNPQEPYNEELDYVKLETFLNSHYLQLMLRSSLATKGLMLGNGVGVIDLDYKGEIKMNIHNPIVQNNFSLRMGTMEYDTDFIIKKGDRIGQLILLEHKSSLFGIASEEERNGGFGSTDKKENK